MVREMIRNLKSNIKSKKVAALVIAFALLLSLGACGSNTPAAKDVSGEVNVFAAASLNKVMTELITLYNEDHPDVTITVNADSSGKLMTQIQEGFECDLFFSAAQSQMNTLEEEGYLVEGTRANVLNNQVVVIARSDTDTQVTGLADIAKAESIALAGGSVPVGKYTRVAMMNLGMLAKTDTPEAYTTEEIMEQIGASTISEQDNVSKVLTAVVEGSCEVGTTYYSDTYGYEDELRIIEVISYELSGNVIYPIARLSDNAAAEDFRQFLLSDKAKSVFEAYYFDTDNL